MEKPISKETRIVLLSSLKKGHFDKDTVKYIYGEIRDYMDRYSYKANLIKIERCLHDSIELDREMKLAILSVLKKGYFGEQDSLLIRGKMDEKINVGSQDELKQCAFDLLDALAEDD